MRSSLLSIYHSLPGPARSAVASARGMYLRRWRYGPETDDLVAAALERDSWSSERWRAWQDEQLARLLHRAATRVPAYREAWAERRRKGDRASFEQLENWPVLTKERLRRDPRAFVADDVNPGSLFREHTSGTTGTPLQLWFGRSTVRAWYALVEARMRRWNGVSRRDRWALLAGQLVVPATATRPPFWVWNSGLSQLYMSSYHLSPRLLPHYIDALSRYRVVYLMGYSSSLAALAGALLDAGTRLPNLKVVLTSAEPLLESQRERMLEAFGCPVRESYGMSEIVTAASECSAGSLHLWPDTGVTEVLSAGTAVPAGGTGELVCTGLLNPDMPLVRYAVGDRASLSAERDRCTCGRSLPRMGRVEGRSDDVLYTRDGRTIGRLDPVFKADLPIHEAQVVQESLERVRVRLVPADGYSDAVTRRISSALRERMGDIDVQFEKVPMIPRTANGKFRAVICALPEAERRTRTE